MGRGLHKAHPKSTTSQLASLPLHSTQQLSGTGRKQLFRSGESKYPRSMWENLWKRDHLCCKNREKLVRSDFLRLSVCFKHPWVYGSSVFSIQVYKYLTFVHETEQAGAENDIQFKASPSFSILCSASLAHPPNSVKIVTSSVSSMFCCQLISVFGCKDRRWTNYR